MHLWGVGGGGPTPDASEFMEILVEKTIQTCSFGYF